MERAVLSHRSGLRAQTKPPFWISPSRYGRLHFPVEWGRRGRGETETHRAPVCLTERWGGMEKSSVSNSQLLHRAQPQSAICFQLGVHIDSGSVWQSNCQLKAQRLVLKKYPTPLLLFSVLRKPRFFYLSFINGFLIS